ncbi:CorA family divalent cation transporter [Rhizobium sp. L1K21]|uniref:CorA family divalent cation transporter n=1 Tax=Rhizobium sp. L1K21 TaxID=2954933 RepID=UPI0020939BC8|nr:CorA family divalent cation transporter [Rhizobium sp. L1K21]MCO6185538.1 transporter [Rhizobium sp. L1K21]
MHLQVSEIPGLVWAYHFPGDGTGARQLHDEQLPDALISQGFVWLHFGLADTRLPAFLESLNLLPESVYLALVTRDMHPSATVEDGWLFGTLSGFQREFDHKSRELDFLHFAVSDRIIITTRLHPLANVELTKNAAVHNPRKFDSPIDVFEYLVREFQRSLFELVAAVTEDLNDIEDGVRNAAPERQKKELQPLRRSIVRLYRHLRTLLTAMRHVAAADEDDMPEEFETAISRINSRLEAGTLEVEALRERARLLYEDINSEIQDETNRHIYILSVITALIMPPTLVTGFFGMNTSGLPFEHGAAGTVMAGAAMLVSVLLAWWAVKKGGLL